MASRAMRGVLRLGPAALAILLLATGCPGHLTSPPPGGSQGVGASPTSPPTPVSAPAVLPVALNGGTLTLTVQDSSGAIAGAQVSAYGPTLAQDVTDSTGTLSLSLLPQGSYAVRIDAAGHVGLTEAFTVTQPRQAITLTAILPTPTRILSGKIVDGSGNPLAGARLSLGDAWTLSALDGSYQLPVSQAGVASVKKTGYAATTTGGGTVALTALPAPKIAFENDPFGDTTAPATTAFSSLEQAVQQAGWTVENRDDPQADVRVWAAPADMGGATDDLATYVHGGGKVVVMADWGGATGYRPDIANAILLPLGVAAETDLVRLDSGNNGRPEWFSPTLPLSPPAQGVSRVSLFGAASLQAASPMQVIAGIPSGGYRVQSIDAEAVGLARQVAAGLVVALGDTNAWMNDSTDDVAQTDNLKFAKNAMLW
ncbi:MAG: carboxypeptidase regulatory-like domain-containing protein [Cyanobacteria bacterium REEB65]|nr:carboxypeptidase regulatory-like domain-containing protein [Cyanobacteria bacterium REEB65]